MSSSIGNSSERRVCCVVDGVFGMEFFFSLDFF